MTVVSNEFISLDSLFISKLAIAVIVLTPVLLSIFLSRLLKKEAFRQKQTNSQLQKQSFSYLLFLLHQKIRSTLKVETWRPYLFVGEGIELLGIISPFVISLIIIWVNFIDTKLNGITLATFVFIMGIAEILKIITIDFEEHE